LTEVSASVFPLEETLKIVSDTTVEIERVAASEESLTLCFWVTPVQT